MDNLFVLVLLAGLCVVLPILALIRLGAQSTRLAKVEQQNLALADKLKHVENLYVALLNAPPPQPKATPAEPAPAAASIPEPTPAPEPEPTPEPAAPPEATPPSVSPPPPVRDAWVTASRPANGWVATPAAPAAAPSAQSVPTPAGKPFDWERFMGVRLPVWLGALALSLAGFFFVRYSIETGLFTPTFRIIGGLIAALGFFIATEVVRQKVKVDNGPQIAAALAAAGIATLYATAYIASAVYNLVPETAGFIAMAAVTIAAIAAALVYGQTVAVVGLLGGYLAPALFPNDDPSALVLFGYLTLVLAGMFAIIRLKHWWNISLVALLGPALWVIIWSAGSGFAANYLWGSAFLIAISAIVIAAAQPFWADDAATVSFAPVKGHFTTPLQAVAIAIALTSAGFVPFIFASGFAIAFWQALTIFSALVLLLALMRPNAMRYMPILPLIATAIAFLGWDHAYPEGFALIVAPLAAIFAVAALDQLRRLQRPAFSAGNLAFVALFFFAITLFRVTGWQAALTQAYYWAFGALVLAAAFVALLWRFGPQIGDEKQRNGTYAILGATVTAFLSLAIAIELDPLYFPLAVALQVLGLAIIHRRVPLPALRFIAGLLAIAYGILIIGAASGEGRDLFSDAAYTFFLVDTLAASPWLQLIVPGLAFLAAGTLFRTNTPDHFADWLDVAGLAMVALGIPVLARLDLFAFGDLHTAAARIFPAQLALALVALFFGRILARRALYYAAIALTALVVAAMLLALILPAYLFWPPLSLPGITVFNITLLSLGLTSALLLAVGWFLRNDAGPATANFGKALSIAAVFCLFTLMILDIRHAFHPLDLQGQMSSSEYYAYSIGMLGFGAVLLVLGVIFRNIGARALSFVFVLAATIKVFMFDAAELEGLWRVLSFFGMGLSFLAISWLYARFVFSLGRKGREQTSPAN